MTKSIKTPLPTHHFYHELMNALLARLDYIRINPVHILNFGVHTEHSCHQLQQRYPNAKITAIRDIQALKKISDESIDFVFGHFPLFINDPAIILREFSRILREEGLLLFTSLGPDTLCELRQCFAKIDTFSHMQDFVDMHHVGDWLKALEFDDPVIDRQTMTLAYDDLTLFFQDLKQLRISKPSINHFPGLYTKKRWKKMLTQYQTYKTGDEYSATIELIFAHAWKVTKNRMDEFVIPIDQIQKR